LPAFIIVAGVRWLKPSATKPNKHDPNKIMQNTTAKNPIQLIASGLAGKSGLSALNSCFTKNRLSAFSRTFGLALALASLASGVAQGATARGPTFVNGIGSWGEPGSVPIQFAYIMSVNSVSIPITKRTDPAGGFELGVARFATTGSWSATITLANASTTITSYSVSPKSRNYSTSVSGRTLTITGIPGPDKLYIQLNSLPPLCVLATPQIPVPTGANVVVVDSGNSTNVITAASNQTIWFNPSAILHGRIVANNVSHLNISGYGTLDAEDRNSNAIYLSGCNDVTTSGLLCLRKNGGWTCRASLTAGANWRHLSVLTWGANGDGINTYSSTNTTVDSCFVYSSDDCITVKSVAGKAVSTVTVTNCTVLGYQSADGFTIGFEELGPVKNVTVVNCNIIGSNGSGNTPSGSHSAFSIIDDGQGAVSNITIKNVNCENLNLRNNLEFAIMNGSRSGGTGPGTISTVNLINVNWANNNNIRLTGYDSSHQISGVTFQNCFIAGRYLNTGDPKLSINAFVNGVTFQ
jgi:hypothetical protein